MSEELKNCPYCGESAYSDEESAAIFGKKAGGWPYAIACRNCEAIGPADNTMAEAVANWNQRHIPESMALVPVEPTEAMLDAWFDADREAGGPLFHNAYKAMIKVSQEG